MGVGPPRGAARDLPMPGARARIAAPRDRAHGARRLPRPRLPRLVPRGHPGGPVRGAQRPGAEPAAGHHPRSGHELLLPQGRPRGRLRLRRADPGSRAHRLAAADGPGPPRRRACPRRGRGTACRAPTRPGADPRMRVVILYDPGAEDWTPEDIRGVMKAVDEIGAIFGRLGHDIRKVPVRHDMRWFQVARRADLVFNLCEGVHGRSEWEEHVVGSLEYVGGREFNVGFVGNRTLPIAEIDFARMPEGAWPILTYAGKWEPGSPDDLGSVPVCPAPVTQKLAERLVKLAEAAWRVMQGKGYGRVDLRVDEQGRSWILEVNPNPDLNDDAGLARMARATGWDYAELVRRVAG